MPVATEPAPDLRGAAFLTCSCCGEGGLRNESQNVCPECGWPACPDCMVRDDGWAACRACNDRANRQAAEATSPDRDRRARDVRERAERRERIATHVLAHLSTEAEALLATSKEFGVTPVEAAAIWACQQADALMAELDRRRDAELQEARDA